jgi:integrase
LKKEGYRESTIIRYVKIIRGLSKRATILDGESVKTVIADSGWTEGTKALACDAYGLFAKMKRFSFEKPIYSRVDSLPFIPLEEELGTLISGSGKKISTFLQFLKDTGARAGEVWNLKWADIDFVKSLAHIRPEKGSEARITKLSGKCISPLSTVPHKSERIFQGNLSHFRRNYELKRRYIAEKFGNPRIAQNHFSYFQTLEGNNRISTNKGLPIRQETAWTQKSNQHPPIHKNGRLPKRRLLMQNCHNS